MRDDERIRSGVISSGAQARRPRDPEKTQALILNAAKTVFAREGLGGSRIETIAEEAGVNKRLIYQYFESKDQLFQRVLEDAWRDIRGAEAELDLDHLAPTEAIRTLMAFTWEYYQQNPEFMSLVNSANLHQARHLKHSKAFQQSHHGFTPMLRKILDRGVQSGEFRADIDPVQLHLTMAAIAYYYLNNRHTSGLIFAFDFTSQEALQKRFEFNLQTILSLLRPQ